MIDILASLRPALIALALFTGLLGIAYPAVVGVIGTAAFSDQAHGSLLRDRAGRVVGSQLIAQPFDDPAYLWSRPSAIAGYSALTSSGTNLGASGFVDTKGTLGPNPALVDAIKTRIHALRAADPGNRAPVPIDLITASGSGLDPHLTPAAAYYQASRIARARGMSDAEVRAVIDAHIEERTLGVLGERRVNVLAVNLALDEIRGRVARQ